jgi:20S proteasome subunit beta 3
MGGQPLVGASARRVLRVHSMLLLGLSGLDGDVRTFAEDIAASLRLLRLEAAEAQASPVISAPALSRLVSSKLYAERARSPLYVEPIIAGLHYESSRRKVAVAAAQGGSSSDNEPHGGLASGSAASTANNLKRGRHLVPFLCSQDSLGAPMVTRDFVASGTCSASLVGLCEALWRPDLPPEELWQVAARCLLGALERDCLSGAGAVVHLITADGITSYELPCPSD